MGLELQLEELLEQQRRAVVQHRTEDADRLQAEIETLQSELAATAEMISGAEPAPDEEPHMHDEEKLAIT